MVGKLEDKVHDLASRTGLPLRLGDEVGLDSHDLEHRRRCRMFIRYLIDTISDDIKLKVWGETVVERCCNDFCASMAQAHNVGLEDFANLLKPEYEFAAKAYAPPASRNNLSTTPASVSTSFTSTTTTSTRHTETTSFSTFPTPPGNPSIRLTKSFGSIPSNGDHNMKTFFINTSSNPATSFITSRPPDSVAATHILKVHATKPASVGLPNSLKTKQSSSELWTRPFHKLS